jgi:MinD superfamily P-loop ATPase
VIASLTGADLALVITEPTPSGESDLNRVLDLARHFRIPPTVVMNKYDLNPTRVDELEARLQEAGIPVLARLPYDERVSKAVRERRLLSECSETWRERLGTIWSSVDRLLNGAPEGFTTLESSPPNMHPEVLGGFQ